MVVFVWLAAPMTPNPAGPGSIVVVGASGFIGKATVALLSKKFPGRVVVATRNAASEAAQGFQKAGARVVPGDLGTPSSLKAAFTGADAVYVITPGTEVRLLVQPQFDV